MARYLPKQWVVLVPRYLGIVQWGRGMEPHGPDSCLRGACHQGDRNYSRLVVENGSLPCHDRPNQYGAGLGVFLEQKSSR